MAALSAELGDGLSGKRCALIGFADDEARLITAALEASEAFTRSFDESTATPGAAALRPFDMIIVNANPKSGESAWLEPEQLTQNTKPLLLIGAPNKLLQRALAVRKPSQDFLLAPWRPEEVVMRAIITLAAAGANGGQPEPESKPKVAVVAVADDDATTVALVKATIERHGFKCLAAKDGASILQAIRQTTPNAVIVDVNMPNMDGFEVLAALRSDPNTAAIPVMLLTALTDEADVVRGFGLGADDYVIKPFNPMELVARLTRLIRKP